MGQMGTNAASFFKTSIYRYASLTTPLLVKEQSVKPPPELGRGLGGNVPN
jgi:hypothetical protein